MEIRRIKVDISLLLLISTLNILATANVSTAEHIATNKIHPSGSISNRSTVHVRKCCGLNEVLVESSPGLRNCQPRSKYIKGKRILHFINNIAMLAYF